MNGQVIITVRSTGSLYYIQTDEMALLAKDGHNENCIHSWHKRLGHRDPQAIKAMSSRNLADSIKIIDCNIIETGENRLYSKSVNDIPITLWNGVKPDMSDVHTFGMRVYAHVPKELRKKLDDKAKELRFIGYSEETKGYRLLDINNDKVTVSRDVRFVKENDKSVTIKLKHYEKNEEPNDLQSESTEEESTGEEGTSFYDAEEDLNSNTYTPMKRGQGRPRIVKTGSRGRPRKQYNMVPIENTEMEATSFAEVSTDEVIPNALAAEWHNAIDDEVMSILKYDVCDIVDRSQGINIIGSRMILTNKINADGTLNRRKARMVAKGCSQRPGFDYDQTFAPVARLSSIRFAVALAVKFGMKIHQLDVATAYLNSSLDVPIYMELPVLFQTGLMRISKSKTVESSIRSKAKEMLSLLKSENKVCRIRKAIYGLKQAGRQWNHTIDVSLKKLGLVASSADPCVYYKGNIKNLLLVIVYVDDTLIFSRSLDEIISTKTRLSERFELKDLGEVQYCLGIRFVKRKDEITLSQVGYINDLLNKYNMNYANPVSTPMEQGLKLNDEKESTQKLPFRELLGSLMYLAMATRPDIAYAVSHLSQFNNCFGKIHWNAAKRILRYLKGTTNYGLTYKANKEPIVGYVDADWGGSTKDRRSYTGFVYILSGAPILWKSRKQRTVALSSTEAEYMGISEASKEAIYWRKIIGELNLEDTGPITIYNDNLGAQKLTENNMYHRRTKHIDIRHHFVREVIENGQINIKYLCTERMVADVLTKALT
ncbi:hypothetical protein KPH14_000901, partial [Odynerus spinipes]